MVGGRSVDMLRRLLKVLLLWFPDDGLFCHSRLYLGRQLVIDEIKLHIFLHLKLFQNLLPLFLFNFVGKLFLLQRALRSPLPTPKFDLQLLVDTIPKLADGDTLFFIVGFEHCQMVGGLITVEPRCVQLPLGDPGLTVQAVIFLAKTGIVLLGSLQLTLQLEDGAVRGRVFRLTLFLGGLEPRMVEDVVSVKLGIILGFAGLLLS
jgi:hypothetical protein